jgi:hypothetical protein
LAHPHIWRIAIATSLRARIRAVGRTSGGSLIVSSICFVFGFLGLAISLAISLFATATAVPVLIAGLGHHRCAAQKRSRQRGRENELHPISPLYLNERWQPSGNRAAVPQPGRLDCHSHCENSWRLARSQR